MKGLILFIAGFAMLGSGILVYFVLGMGFAEEPAGKHSSWLGPLLQYGIGGLLSLIGLSLIIGGFKAKARAARDKKEYEHIMLTGIATEGQVTFVDKNYSIRVNKVPIYSIVEYTYKDRTGKQHIKRVNYFSSEQVIRKQIEVGKNIAVKYAVENSGKSVIVV